MVSVPCLENGLPPASTCPACHRRGEQKLGCRLLWRSHPKRFQGGGFTWHDCSDMYDASRWRMDQLPLRGASISASAESEPAEAAAPSPRPVTGTRTAAGSPTGTFVAAADLTVETGDRSLAAGERCASKPTTLDAGMPSKDAHQNVHVDPWDPYRKSPPLFCSLVLEGPAVGSASSCDRCCDWFYATPHRLICLVVLSSPDQWAAGDLADSWMGQAVYDFYLRTMRRLGHQRWFRSRVQAAGTPTDRLPLPGEPGRLSMGGSRCPMLLTTTGGRPGNGELSAELCTGRLERDCRVARA